MLATQGDKRRFAGYVEAEALLGFVAAPRAACGDVADQVNDEEGFERF